MTVDHYFDRIEAILKEAQEDTDMKSAELDTLKKRIDDELEDLTEIILDKREAELETDLLDE